MSYTADILDHRVSILAPKQAEAFGDTAQFECVATVYAAVTWNKGMKSLREGALDAYDVVMVRMRWNDLVNRHCRLECDGKTYQIMQLNSDKRDNQIQIIAQELITDEDEI